MKAIYAADLHGDVQAYEELRKWIGERRAELLLLGGDLLAHSRSLRKQLAFIEGEWVAFAQSLSVPVALTHGNIEWAGAAARLRELTADGVGSWLSSSPLSFGALRVSGYGMTNLSPFADKDHERRDLRADSCPAEAGGIMTTPDGTRVPLEAGQLDSLPSMEEELEAFADPGIWVMHAPPFDTRLDQLRGGAHVGSRAVRQRIEQVRPQLTLHGHIHESPYVSGSWYDYIGPTLCINPGSGSGLHAVCMEWDAEGRLLSAEHSRFGAAELRAPS